MAETQTMIAHLDDIEDELNAIAHGATDGERRATRALMSLADASKYLCDLRAELARTRERAERLEEALRELNDSVGDLAPRLIQAMVCAALAPEPHEVRHG